MISFDAMQQAINRHIALCPVLATERVPLANSVGRILASSVQASVAIPRFTVSAMDGYALHSDAALTQYPVIGQSIAGQPFVGDCPVDACIRIMTGAVVPEGYNTVVMQENITLVIDNHGNSHIQLNHPLKPRTNIRYAGEETAQGETIINTGHIVQPSDLPLLASAGISQLTVYTQLVVGVLSCGDELSDIGQPLSPHTIYDSNRISLQAQLQPLPVRVIDYGIARDDIGALHAILSQAASECDILISSAGVSVGDYDYMRTVVAQLGVIHQYKIAMKPGKPFVFGQIGRAVYFGLPGNPVSSFIGFSQLVRPALWQRAGAAVIPQPLTVRAVLTAPIAKKPGRMDFQRAHLCLDPSSIHQFSVSPVGQGQDSHRVAAVSQANSLIVLALEDGHKHVGELVQVQLFSSDFGAIGTIGMAAPPADATTLASATHSSPQQGVV